MPKLLKLGTRLDVSLAAISRAPKLASDLAIVDGAPHVRRARSPIYESDLQFSAIDQICSAVGGSKVRI
jgi:hypothetical protein